MIEMKFYRTGVLPGTLEANAFYLVRNADNGQLEITATGPDAVPVKAINQSQILSLIEANIPDSADSLTTARTISMTGDANWSVSFDGSKNETGAITLLQLVCQQVNMELLPLTPKVVLPQAERLLKQISPI